MSHVSARSLAERRLPACSSQHLSSRPRQPTGALKACLSLLFVSLNSIFVESRQISTWFGVPLAFASYSWLRPLLLHNAQILSFSTSNPVKRPLNRKRAVMRQLYHLFETLVQDSGFRRQDLCTTPVKSAIH